MSNGAALLAILGAVLLGPMSPGPSFLLVSRISAALGTLALVGLGALLAAVDHRLAVLLQLGVGLYLLHLGLRIWRGAAVPCPRAPGRRVPGARLRHGPADTARQSEDRPGLRQPVRGSAPWLPLVLPVPILAVETAWYALVALGFPAPRPRAFYLRARLWIDPAQPGRCSG